MCHAQATLSVSARRACRVVGQCRATQQYGCVLGLGLYLNGSHTIKGEVVRVDPSAYFVKQYDGDQVRVHTDTTTRMPEAIRPGDHIEAMVTAQRHALAIRQAK